MPCYKFPDKCYLLRNAINLYGWLKHHIQDKKYMGRPKDDTSRTAVFIQEWKLNNGISCHLIQPDKTLINYLATHQST
jgi:hypothetical protein